jgi:hypothetical protein
MVIMTVQSAAPLIRQGRLKAIAMSEPERNKVFPNVPTAQEQVPGYPRLNGYVFMLAAAAPPGRAAFGGGALECVSLGACACGTLPRRATIPGKPP